MRSGWQYRLEGAVAKETDQRDANLLGQFDRQR